MFDIEAQGYINKAIGEIQTPTLEITKQHMDALELELDAGLPKLARVDMEFHKNTVAVWFYVKGEGFYFIVNISKDPEILPCFSWVESGNKVYLTATSEHLSYKELTHLTKLKPLEGWSKGDPKKRGNSCYNFSRIYYDPIKCEAYEMEEKLRLLLTEIENDRKGVKLLAKNAEAYIAIHRYQYVSGNAGIHFDLETISRLSTLNLEIDINTSISGKPLK